MSKEIDFNSPLVRVFACDDCGCLGVYKGLNASRPSMHTTEFDCHVCARKTPHTREPNGFPRMAFGNHGGIPNDTGDEKEYEQWQRAEYKKYGDKLHTDNLGAAGYKGLRHLTGE